MYETFFGFREKPFNLTPDPRFLYLSAKHSEAFAHLEFGLKERGGFVVISGEVGTGKTTLCRYFLDRLDENTLSAFILYPALSDVELLKAINEDLGVDAKGERTKDLIDALHRFLLKANAEGKNIVVVIDEAQDLSPQVLEHIRLISNLETSTSKLIQIILIGQSELNTVLAQRSLRQLAQRVTARYHLRPLNREDTTHYIRHRLGVAGGAGKVSFTAGALRKIHRFTKGTPRLINLLCDRVLLAGFVLSRREIDKKLVTRAIRELDAADLMGRRWYQSWGLRGVAAAAVAFGLAFSLWPFPQGKFSGAEEPVELAASQSLTHSPESPVAPPDVLAPDAFSRRLSTLSSSLSRRGAAATLLRLWNVRLGGGLAALSPEENLASMARRVGLHSVTLTANLDQLRQLNLPAVLELSHPSRHDACFTALSQLEGETALVSFAPGDEARIELAVLERFWTRRATVYWKDYEGDAGSSSDVGWARKALRELGYLSSHTGSDTDIRAALVAFQGSSYLAPDGIFGPRTRMALYSRSGMYPVPRLYEP